MRHICHLLFALACLTAVSFAAAGSVQQQSLESLSREADVIVRGRVAEVTYRPASERRPISTIIKVTVENQFKGTKLSSLTIQQPGGTQGDISLGVTGSPEFHVGEDVIVFLRRQRGDAFRIVGGKQGKLSIETEQPTNRETVKHLARRKEPLEDFVERLASTLEKK